MRPLPIRRFAPLLMAGAVTVAATGCASTLNDAATITLRDREGTHTYDIDRAEFQQDLAALVGNAKFQQWAREQQVTPRGDNKNTTDQLFAGFLLRQRINQIPYDREFDALDLKVTPAMRDQARKQLTSEFALQSELAAPPSGGGANGQNSQPTFVGPGVVFNSFPKWLQDRLIEREARAYAVINYYRGANPTPEQVSRFYQEFAAQLCPSNRALAHIAVRDEAGANALLRKIKSGQTSFASAAKQSLDTVTANNGGFVGCFTPGSFVKEVEDAASKAPLDTPIGPIKTPQGYEIVLVTRPSLASLGPQIAQAMGQGAAIDLRMDQMKVRVDPRYGTAQRSQQGFTVKPPAVPNPRDQRDRSNAPATTTVPGGGG